MKIISSRMAFLMFKSTLNKLDKRFIQGTRSGLLTRFIEQWSCKGL
jgi:hypothetical protein